MLFVDTSALYALADASDAHHADARELAQQIHTAGEELLLHTYVLAETCALVHRRLGLKVMLRVSDETSRLRTVVVDRALHDRGVEWLRAHGSRDVSLVDAVSFAVMTDEGLTTAFAFDPDFERGGFRLYGR